MRTYSWTELLSHTLEYSEYSRNDSILNNITQGNYLVFVKREDAKNYTKEDAELVDMVDESDSSLPIRLLQEYSGDTWVGIKEHRNKNLVVVPKAIFEQSQTITATPTTNGTNTMSNTIQARRTVRIELIDNDAGLDVQHALVAAYDNVITEDDDATTIQELIMNRDIARKLREHNTIREAQVDLDVLKRTGNTVHLQPVKLKDLTWIVK